MPTFQVTCREVVYMDRTYEIDAASAEDARLQIENAKGGDRCVDEEIYDSYQFCGVQCVCETSTSMKRIWPRLVRGCLLLMFLLSSILFIMKFATGVRLE